MAKQVGHPGIDPDVEKLHAGRDDPDEWGEELAAVRVRPTTTSVVSFRMPHGELDRLQRIAGAQGESVSDFVRDAIRVRIGHLSGTGVDESLVTTAGTPELDVIARIDGVEVAEVIQTALASHVAARRRDPAFQERIRDEQTLLNSLAD